MTKRDSRLVTSWYVALANLIVVASSGCATTFADAYPRENVPKVRILCGSADIIFVGTVTRVGPKPPVWSGTATIQQEVSYSVERFLKGERPERTIEVRHLVVEGSRQASKDAPGLLPEFFSPGRKLLVLAVWRTDHFEDQSENVSVIPHSDRNESALIQLLE